VVSVRRWVADATTMPAVSIRQWLADIETLPAANELQWVAAMLTAPAVLMQWFLVVIMHLLLSVVNLLMRVVYLLILVMPRLQFMFCVEQVQVLLGMSYILTAVVRHLLLRVVVL